MIVTGDRESCAASALPPLDVSGPVAVVPIEGGADMFTEWGIELLCYRLARDPEVRTVVVSIRSEISCCNPADLLAPVERLALSKSVFSFVEVAMGAAMFCALPARAIVCHPQARIGRLGVATSDGMDVATRNQVAKLNEELLATVRRYRPAVEARIARRLLDYEISGGEVLEHFGFADFVMSLERLLAALRGNQQ